MLRGMMHCVNDSMMLLMLHVSLKVQLNFSSPKWTQ